MSSPVAPWRRECDTQFCIQLAPASESKAEEEKGEKKIAAIPAFLNEPRVQTPNEPTREESQLLN